MAKKSTILALISLVSSLPFGILLAAGPNILVSGADDPVCETPYYIDGGGGALVTNPANVIDCDVERIQDAVDSVVAGGTVKLQGTFNLGTELPFINQEGHQTWQPDFEGEAGGRESNPPNPAFWDNPRATVFITRNVEIRGVHGATIVGGYAPLAVGLAPRAFEYVAYDLDFWFIGGVAGFVPVESVVKDLSFVNPAFAGVAVFATTGAELKNNRFEDMQLVPSRIFVPYAPAIFVDGGIAAAASYPDIEANYPYQPGDWISGEIRIVGNSVNGDWGVDPDGVENPNYGGLPMNGCNTGIHIWYVNAGVEVKDNSVERCWEGIRSSQQWGTTTIRGNFVQQPDEFPGVAVAANAGTTWTAYPYPYFEAGRAIIADNVMALTPGGAGILATYQDAAQVAANSISGPGVIGIGHWAGVGAIIKDNEIQMDDVPWGAISLEDFAFGARVSNNTIVGSGRAAIRLGFPFAPCEANTVAENDLQAFVPEAHLDFFGVTYIGSHIELLWGAAANTIRNNRYSMVDSGDDTVQNVYFAGPIPPYGLPGATGNVLREPQALKIMDFTDPNGPGYDPDTYAGANDILLGD